MNTKSDFQDLLPEKHREALVVLPRSSMWRVPLACMLLGVGFGISASTWFGHAQGILGWAFPVAVVVCWVIQATQERGDRRMAEMVRRG